VRQRAGEPIDLFACLDKAFEAIPVRIAWGKFFVLLRDQLLDVGGGNSRPLRVPGLVDLEAQAVLAAAIARNEINNDSSTASRARFVLPSDAQIVEKMRLAA
jgi:hypothetical protein